MKRFIGHFNGIAGCSVIVNAIDLKVIGVSF